MYNQILLTLILLTLLWIALALQIIAGSIRLLGRLFRPTPRKLRALERNSMPWIAKMIVVKVVGHYTIRYVGKKLR